MSKMHKASLLLLYIEEIGNDAEVLDVARGLEFAATVCPFDVTVEGDSVNVIR